MKPRRIMPINNSVHGGRRCSHANETIGNVPVIVMSGFYTGLAGVLLLLVGGGVTMAAQTTEGPKIEVQPAPVGRDVRPGLSFAPIIKKIAPSVVTIYSTK